MDEALSGTDSKWWELSSISEVNNFLSRGAWKFVLKSTIGNRKLVGTKVVFKKKDEPDGTTRFKTRIVTLGYMQIPGVDYTEKFSPVANDTSVRIVFALVLYYYDSHGWRTKILDVEAAFLEGDLGVPMFLKIPDIMVRLGFLSKEQQEKYCIDLQSGMYGNVDAALRFFVKLVTFLVSDEVGMKQSLADPCVVYLKNDEGFPLVVGAITVDDCLLGGKPEGINALMDKIEKKFKVTMDNDVKRHLGIDYTWKRDEKNEIYLEATMDKKATDIVNSCERYILVRRSRPMRLQVCLDLCLVRTRVRLWILTCTGLWLEN